MGWFRAFRRADTNWNPDNGGVSELHFRPDDFLNQSFRKIERQQRIIHAAVPPALWSNNQSQKSDPAVLSGYSIHTVSEDMETARRQRHADDASVVGELIEMVSVDGRLQLEETEQAIAHLAGYLARSALKKYKCDACHSQLVCNTPAKVTAIELEQTETVTHSSETQMALRSFIELLNRGRLVFPSDTVLTVT